MFSGALRFLRLRNFWKKTSFRKLYVWLKNCFVLSCFKMPFAGLNFFFHVICAKCLLLSYKQVTKWYFPCNLELLSNRTFFKDYLSWGVVHFSLIKKWRVFLFFPNSPQKLLDYWAAKSKRNELKLVLLQKCWSLLENPNSKGTITISYRYIQQDIM